MRVNAMGDDVESSASEFAVGKGLSLDNLL